MSSIEWVKDIVCPACGHYGTIFLAAENYLTCSFDKCPNPDYAEALKAKREAEKVTATKQGALNALTQLHVDYLHEWIGTDAVGNLKHRPRALEQMLTTAIMQYTMKPVDPKLTGIRPV